MSNYRPSIALLLLSFAVLASLLFVPVHAIPPPPQDLLPPPAASYESAGCKNRTFTQLIDHFNSSDTRTFGQRIFVCTAYFPTSAAGQVANGTIIVELGNESVLKNPVWPIVFENAQRTNALIIAVEHRYYGVSFPFAVPSSGQLETSQYVYLDIRQVMADTKLVLDTIRSEMKISSKVPVLVVGGSYGGQLSSYHRLTYPDTFQAAIAASAPVNYVLNTTRLLETEENFHVIVGKALDVMTGNTTCSTDVRMGLDMIKATQTQNATARRAMAENLGLCRNETVLDVSDSIPMLLAFLYDAFVGAVQLNDQAPYPNYILEMCAVVASTLAKEPGNYPKAVVEAERYANQTAADDCVDFVAQDQLLPPPSASAIWPSYNYQCCSQGTVLSAFFSSNASAGTLLPNYTITTPIIRTDCIRYFGSSVPGINSLPVMTDFYTKLRELGQIVFTNGDLDHWSGGSITSNITGVKMGVVIYPNGSHCTDTHSYNFNNTLEPPSYKMLRAQAVDKASVWMEEWRGKQPNGVGRVAMGLLSLLVPLVVGVVMIWQRL